MLSSILARRSRASNDEVGRGRALSLVGRSAKGSAGSSTRASVKAVYHPSVSWKRRQFGGKGWWKLASLKIGQLDIV